MVSDVELPGLNGRQIATIAAPASPQPADPVHDGYAADAIDRPNFSGPAWT